MTSISKKISSLTFFLLVAYKAYAPGSAAIVIIENVPVNPFKQLISAIGMVETKYDTMAYNPKEEAVGYFQIRPIRVEDYNKRTGSTYTKMDMYDYHVSEKIFLYYASQIGPYNFKRIAQNWNGSGPKTVTYWNRVKKFL